MNGFAVHPGAVSPYERLSGAEAEQLGSAHPMPSKATAYYGRLARRAGDVLEYGAGRGYVTWEMARRGARVTAVDLSAPLLQELAVRGKQEDATVRKRVRVVEGDMRTLRLRRRFPLVVAPLDTFLHLYNRRDVEAFLSGVLYHLTPDGQFVFDVTVPCPEQLVSGYDPLSQVHVRELGGVPMAQRHFFPQELEMLLWYNGLARVRFKGDFGSRRPDRDTRVLVVIANSGAARRDAVQNREEESRRC